MGITADHYGCAGHGNIPPSAAEGIPGILRVRDCSDRVICDRVPGLRNGPRSDLLLHLLGVYGIGTRYLVQDHPRGLH